MGGCDSKESHFDHIKAGDAAAARADTQHSAQEREKLLEVALGHYQLALDMNPNYYVTYMRRGQVLQKLGRFDDAVGDFTDCQELNPMFYAAAFAKADCYDEMEEFDMAVMERSRIPHALREQRAVNVQVDAIREKERQERAAAEARRMAVHQRALDTNRYAPRAHNADAVIVNYNEYGGENEELKTAQEAAEEAAEEHRIREYAKAAVKIAGRREMTDEEKYAPLEDKWRKEMVRAHNVKRFLHGQRGIYVKSAAQKRAIEVRGQQRTAFAHFSMQQELGAAKGYSAV